MAPADPAGVAAAGPVEFRRAAAGLSGRGLRPGTQVTELPAPARLAPWSYAVSVAVVGSDGAEAATGRLVLLHDPAGVPAWDGTLRIVVFGTCEVDDAMAEDPMLADVTWSWLTEQLAAHHVGFTALGGTVTTTCSSRFGDIAGPTRTDELELRASWTATDPHTAPHLAALADFLAAAAGLFPDGVAPLRHRGRPFAGQIS